ncbi:MAG: DUF2188 domain-containing protein [Bdellovibrionaceae bacterium]|nr:DUF2188 domain-containing protein [Pseudobdellovibrionaceae bacterium]
MARFKSGSAPEKALHVIEDSDGWIVMEGDSGGERRFETKSQALQEARRLSVERGVEVVVHGADGGIQERDVFVR